MKDYQRREDDFHAYLDGRMPPEARHAFEAEIAADPELAELLDLHRAERAVMAAFREQHLRAIWEKHSPESVFADPPPVPFFKKRKFWLALAGLFVVGILFWKIFSRKEEPVPSPPIEVPNDSVPAKTTPSVEDSSKTKTPGSGQKPPSNQPIANAELKNYVDQNLEGYLPPRPSGSEKPDSVSRLGRAEKLFFDDNEYDAALALLQPPDSSNLRKAVWLRGHVFFKKGDFQRAADDFGWLANAPLAPGERVRSFGNEAAWNELCCLALLRGEERERRGFSEKLLKMKGMARFQERVERLETAVLDKN